VAAAGNEHEEGNPIEYLAAALQPPGSNGQGGVGLSVGASNMAGRLASCSNDPQATASGGGRWNPRLGYGVIDVAAAVAVARGQTVTPRMQAGSWLGVHRVSRRGLRWRKRSLVPVRGAFHLAARSSR
jgi:hypothetical protein